MNHSIKSRFILIYVVLVLISMFIASTFIIDRLENVQIETATTSMEKTMDTLATTTSAFFKDNNYKTLPQLDQTLKDWGISSEESAYIISSDEVPQIIASTKNISSEDSKDAYSFKYIEPKLVMDALKGKNREKIVDYKNEKAVEKHIARPIFSADGKILAIIYMTRNLNSVYSVIEDSKVIITYATIISLITTSILIYTAYFFSIFFTSLFSFVNSVYSEPVNLAFFRMSFSVLPPFWLKVTVQLSAWL